MNIIEYKNFFNPFFDCFNNIYSFDKNDIIEDTISYFDLNPLYNDQFKNNFFSFLEKNTFHINQNDLLIFLNDYQENYYHVFPYTVESCMNIKEFFNYWIKYFDIEDILETYQECYQNALQHHLNNQLETF